MKIEFVHYELALRMRNLGFNEPCFVWADIYTKENVYMYPTNENNMNQYDETVSIPLFQQAFRWFREKYSWQHSIDPTSDQHSFELGYNYWIWNYKTGEEYHTMPKNRPTADWEYKTYEEAELACLEKLIEIVELKSDYEREE